MSESVIGKTFLFLSSVLCCHCCTLSTLPHLSGVVLENFALSSTSFKLVV
jgi:hypothetical protein